MQGLHFTKFSATGNDFVLIDNRESKLSEKDADFYRRICQRRTSVGADGVLLIDACQEADFRLRYFNADGSESECGNGARSAAYFAVQHGIASRRMRFRFGKGLYEAEVSNRSVRLALPGYRDLNLSVGILDEKDFEEGGTINTGVPHYVMFANDIDRVGVSGIGKKYRYHARFQPEGTNVNFVQIVGRDRIRIRTYERGVEAETLSCGTGSVACAWLAHFRHGLQFPLKVATPGGELTVHKHEKDLQSYLEGEVKPVYEGKLMTA